MKVITNTPIKRSPIKKVGSSSTKNVKSRTGPKKGSAEVILEMMAAETYSISFGKAPLEHSRLIVVTGLKPKTVMNNLAKLKQNGWNMFDSKTLELTIEGVKRVGSLATMPKTKEELHARFKQNLKGKSIKFFELLEDGCAQRCDHIAAKLGYDSAKQKSFVNLKGSLKGKGIIEYSSDKQSIQLSNVCFPLGRLNSELHTLLLVLSFATTTWTNVRRLFSSCSWVDSPITTVSLWPPY
jgi:hypothetical protein